MIPHSMLSNENEIFGNGNGLKNRVTACRQRLRLNRIHRAQVDNELEKLSLETAIRASDFSGYSGEDAALRETVVHTREGVPARDGQTSQRVDGQGVGIT